MLCPTHHVLVDGDGEVHGRTPSLDERRHRDLPTASELEIDDAIARKIQRAMIVGATMGAAAGAAVAGYSAAQGVAPVLDWLLAMFFRQTHDPRSERRRARRQLLEILRFGPTGHIATGTTNCIGGLAWTLVSSLGKQVVFIQMRFASTIRLWEAHVWFSLLWTRGQIPNAKRTVDQLLDHLGFQPADQGTYETNSGRHFCASDNLRTSKVAAKKEESGSVSQPRKGLSTSGDKHWR